MTRYVFDSWAWLEYLEGSKKGDDVSRRVSGDNELWTSAVSLAEMVSKYRRKSMAYAKAFEAVGSLSKVGVPDREDAIAAGRIHAEMKERSPNFSLADSFVLQLARKVDARVLTGDPDFRGIREAELLG